MKSLIYITIAILLSNAMFFYFKDDGNKILPEKEDMYDYITAGYYKEPVSGEELKNKFNRISISRFINPKEKIKILLVPGHDDVHKGAEFNGVHELDLNIELSEKIKEEIEKDKRFEVLLLSDYKTNKKVDSYIEENKIKIERLEKHHKEVTKKLQQEGLVLLKSGIDHNFAHEEMINKLYGINFYSNDQKIDLVIHVHFNNYHRYNMKKEGEYEGFSIYYPTLVYNNGEVSKELGTHLMAKMMRVSTSSTNPAEEDVLIEDSELIAVGAYNTLKVPALLVEYGYVYEKNILEEDFRVDRFNLLANATKEGILGFLKSD